MNKNFRFSKFLLGTVKVTPELNEVGEIDNDESMSEWWILILKNTNKVDQKSNIVVFFQNCIAPMIASPGKSTRKALTNQRPSLRHQFENLRVDFDLSFVVLKNLQYFFIQKIDKIVQSSLSDSSVNEVNISLAVKPDVD